MKRLTHHWQYPLVVGLGLSISALAQGGGGGRRGAAAAGAPTANAQGAAPAAGRAGAAPAGAQAAGRGGRGGGAGAGGGTSDLYNYDAAAAGEVRFPEGPAAESHQKITVGGEALAYTVHAGYMPLVNATDGRSEAHLFYTYYSKDGVTNAATRPIVFFLGGAPGVSTSLEEFAGLGPKILRRPADGSAGLPPYASEDNPNTVLSAADLVFVSPVGTGYSRPDSAAAATAFDSTNGDNASLGEFVRAFLGNYDRWNSPRILAGEDAATGRTTGVALYLTEHQIPVNAVALLGITTTADATAGDEQYMTLLPTEALAAYAHKKLAADLQAMTPDQVAEAARTFASREYLHALYKGDRMTAAERTQAINNVARFTGLSKQVVINNDLRFPWDRFNSEILHNEHESLSASDDRVASFQAAAGGGRGGGFGGGGGGGLDIAENNLATGMGIAYQDYVKALGARTVGMFYLLSGGTTYTSTGNDETSLSGLLQRSPQTRVWVGISYYNATTPFYATEFTLAHLNLAPAARAHLSTDHFDAGQAVYADAQASAKLHADLLKLITAASGPAGN